MARKSVWVPSRKPTDYILSKSRSQNPYLGTRNWATWPRKDSIQLTQPKSVYIGLTSSSNHSVGVALDHIPCLWRTARMFSIPTPGTPLWTKDYSSIIVTSFILKTIETLVDFYICTHGYRMDERLIPSGLLCHCFPGGFFTVLQWLTKLDYELQVHLSDFFQYIFDILWNYSNKDHFVVELVIHNPISLVKSLSYINLSDWRTNT